MSLSDHMREHRRLIILRCLTETAGYVSNSSVLMDHANRWGVVSTRDDVRTDSAWLAEQGLVTVEQISPSVSLVTLTARGHDVAEGRAIVPGVRRPSPR